MKGGLVPGRLPPPEMWRIEHGTTDDLQLLASVQAEAYLTVTPNSAHAQRLSAMSEPGAALFVLEGQRGSPLAFAVLRNRRGQCHASVAVLIPLTPNARVEVLSALMRCVETSWNDPQRDQLVLHFPDLLPDQAGWACADLPASATRADPKGQVLEVDISETWPAGAPPYWTAELIREDHHVRSGSHSRL